MINWFKNLFRSNRPTADDLDDRDREILRLKKELVQQIDKTNSMEKLDKRAQFELKAKMDTKVRVWYRENKDILSRNELEKQFYAMKKEVDKIDAQIKSDRAVLKKEIPIEEDFHDFTKREMNPVGLSATSK